MTSFREKLQRKTPSGTENRRNQDDTAAFNNLPSSIE